MRGVFDEIVVVDTGSTDRTIEIARSFGAKVFEFAWVDSFAAAQNEALSHATGDCAFWLDADDVIEPVEREKLRALLAGLRRASGTARPCVGSGDLTVRHSGQVMRPAPNAGPFPSGEHAGAADEPGFGAGSPSPALRAPSPRGGEGDWVSRTPYAAAYVVRCACDPSTDRTAGKTVVDQVRLFTLRDGVRSTYRVHEQILPALNRARVPVRWTELTIRHTGYADDALRARCPGRVSRRSRGAGKAGMSCGDDVGRARNLSLWGREPVERPGPPRWCQLGR